MSPKSPDAAEYEPIDENGDQPVTRAEFHDAMRGVGNSFASVQSNIAEIRVDMATNQELLELKEQLDAKIAKLATKEELAGLEERLTARMDAQAGSIVKAVSRHIDIAVDRAVQRHIQPLDERISRLEKISGLSSAA